MKKLVFSVIALLAITSAGQAAPKKPAAKLIATTATTAATVAAAAPTALSSAEAKAKLDKFSAFLAKSFGVSYSSKMSYADGTPTGPVIKASTVIVTVERPAKISIHLSAAGALSSVVNSDGTTFTLYDATSGKYSSMPTTSDLNGTIASLEQTGQLVFPAFSPSGDALKNALRFPLSCFLAGQVDIKQAPQGSTLTYTSAPVKLAGVAVESLTEALSSPHYGSVKFMFFVNPLTEVLVEQKMIAIPPAGQNVPAITILDETFSNWKYLTSPAPASTYAYTPPSTATVATPPAPAPTTPSTESPAPSNPPSSDSTSVPGAAAPSAPPAEAPAPQPSPAPAPGGGMTTIPVAPGAPAPAAPMPPPPPI